MSTSARYKLLNSSEDDGVQGRFGDRYESGKDGKYVLLAQCVASGYILKECGLQDIVLELDNLPEYRNGTASQRRALFLGEIARLMGNSAVLPAQPPAQPAPATHEVVPAPVAATSETLPIDIARVASVAASESEPASRRPNLAGQLIESDE